jgi:hypothetical protein
MELKTFLSDHDKKETGRVPLSSFYQLPSDQFSFHEPKDYLRELGALDESSTLIGPQVIITNYVYGMSNCLSSTPYYSVCCLNECEGLLQQIETEVAKPSATAADILDALKRISSTSFDTTVTARFQTRLEEIAAKGNGKVPLHGRLFAQWLHYVFPRQCPFPHAAGSVKAQTQGERLTTDQDVIIEDDERAKHTQQVEKVTLSRKSQAEDNEDELWSWDEELMHASEHLEMHSTTDHGQAGPRLLPSLIALAILWGVKRMHAEAAKNSLLLPMTIQSVKSHDL